MFAVVMCLVLLMCSLIIRSGVVCINGRRYVCCSGCNVVSDECDESTPALCNLSVRTVVKLCTFGVFALGVSLVS